MHSHICLVCGFGWPEAVGDLHSGMAVLIAPGGDLLDEEPDQLAPLLQRLFGIGFDLFDATRQSNEPRGG